MGSLFTATIAAFRVTDRIIGVTVAVKSYGVCFGLRFG